MFLHKFHLSNLAPPITYTPSYNTSIFLDSLVKSPDLSLGGLNLSVLRIAFSPPDPVFFTL